MTRKYKQISQEERNEIFLLLSSWFTKKQISQQLWRHPSTITRELKRNSSLISSKFNSLPIKQPQNYHYLPDTAQNKRNIRRKNANYRPPCKNPQILQFVIQHLQKWWSPDIISWTLKKFTNTTNPCKSLMKQSINSSTQKNEKSSNLKTISQENINAEKRKLEELSTNHKKSQIE